MVCTIVSRHVDRSECMISHRRFHRARGTSVDPQIYRSVRRRSCEGHSVCHRIPVIPWNHMLTHVPKQMGSKFWRNLYRPTDGHQRWRHRGPLPGCYHERRLADPYGRHHEPAAVLRHGYRACRVRERDGYLGLPPTRPYGYARSGRWDHSQPLRISCEPPSPVVTT